MPNISLVRPAISTLFRLMMDEHTDTEKHTASTAL